MRIVRICTLEGDREKRFSELKNLLLSRDYKPKVIDAAILKARNIPRKEALKRVCRKKSSDRPVFVINYNPGLPSIPSFVKKHWRSMTQDPRMKEILPKPPLVAYKRPPNIKDKLYKDKSPKIIWGKTQKKHKRNEKMPKVCNLPICQRRKSNFSYIKQF